MKTICFFAISQYGHILPTLNLARALVEERYRVLYFCDNQFKKYIEGTGAIHVADGSAADIERFSQDSTLTAIEVNVFAGKTIQSRLRNMLADMQIDLIIYDTYAFWGKEIAVSRCIPVAASIATMAYDEQILSDNRYGFFEGEDLYRQYLPPLEIPLKVMSVQSRFIAKKADMANFKLLDLICGKERLNFVYTSRLIQFNDERFDNSYCFLGASFPQEKPEAWMDELPDKPWIYISKGTVFNKAEDFIHLCIKIASAFPMNIIISLGKGIPVERFTNNTPPNITIKSFIAQSKVLERSRMFITNGGMSSVNMALYYGVPMVILPDGSDDFANARRIEELNAGVFIPPADRSEKSLRNAFERVLGDRAMREACRCLSKDLQSVSSMRPAVEAIRSLLEI